MSYPKETSQASIIADHSFVATKDLRLLEDRHPSDELINVPLDEETAEGENEYKLRLVVDDVPIRGHVIDLQGGPVPGARVWVGELDAVSQGPT